MQGSRLLEATCSCFFLSYAQQDATYVARLAEHLRRHNLPVWFDADLAWGDRVSREIQRRLGFALAVIVIMSPAAEASDWVEREILEGQRHDRDFLPILVRGDRLFLLASSQYFDARDGALPGDRELRQLEAIRDRSQTGTREGPPIVLPQPTSQPAPAASVPVDVSLRKLQSFLTEGLVEHADILTTSLLLEAAGRLEDGWMRAEDGARVPFDLLYQIDEVWSRSSGGTQGFRVQLERGPVTTGGGRRVFSEWADFSSLALSLGWNSGGGAVTPTYGTFIKATGYPVGFFPTLRNPQLERYGSWHDRWMHTVTAVHRRLGEWTRRR